MIEVQFQWSESEFRRYLQDHAKWTAGTRKTTRHSRWLGLAITGFTFVAAATGTTPFVKTLPFLIAGILLIGLSFPASTAYFGLRLYRRMKFRDQVCTYSFGEERIVLTTGVSRNEIQWVGFSRVVITDAGLLFYTEEMIAHWLPITAFRSPDDITDLASLAKSKGLSVEDHRKR